jgi:transposase
MLGERQMEIYHDRALPVCRMMRHYSIHYLRFARRATVMGDVNRIDALLCSGARRLSGHRRRLFMAEVATELCDSNARQAEERFGWGRETVSKGLQELRSGIRCLENFPARGRQRSEDKNQQLAADIRAIVEPHTQTDPELKSSRRYANLSAEEVRDALIVKGHDAKKLPSIRTLRDILNRMNYRLKRIQKGKPLKKTKDTDAIFANLRAVREEARNDPETLEISMDTKAKVKMGDYALGGKNADERCG